MNIVLLTLYALPPIIYAIVYMIHSVKRRKPKAAIGVFILSLLALCCFILLISNF